MANKFDLAARLTLEGPFGIKPVVDKINKSLKNVDVKVNVDINQQSVKSLNDLAKQSAALRSEFKLLSAEAKIVNTNIQALAKSINTISTASSGLSQKFGKSAKTVSADVRQIGTEFGKLSKRSEVLKKLEVNKTLPDSLNRISTGLSSVETGLRNVSQVSQPVVTSLGSINKSIASSSAASQKFANTQSRTNAVIAATGRGAAEAASEVEDFGRISGLALRRFAAFSIATSLVFGFFNAVTRAVGASIDFERELLKVSQVTGTSVQGLKNLNDTIDNLSTSLGVSSSEILNSARTLSQAGFSANQVRQSLEAIAKTDLSPTFNNIAETTEGAIASIRQFNLEVTDLDSALGSINAVSAKFAVESSDIIGAIQRAGGVFASTQNNIVDSSESLRQFISLFTSVRATTRESAETIAVALRTIFTRIQRRGTIDALRELNIELLNSQGKFVGAFEAIKRLSEGLGGLDTRDQRFAAITEDVAGVRQIGKFIPLIQQFATAQEALKVAQEGTDSTSKNAEQALQSLGNQIDRTGERFLKLVRDVSQTDTFKSIATSILTVTNSLISLSSSIRPLLPILAVLAGVQAVRVVPTFARGLFRSNSLGGGSDGSGGDTPEFKAVDKGNRIQDANTKAQVETVAALKENTAAIKGETVAAKTPSRIDELRARRDFEGTSATQIQGRARTAAQRAMLVRAGQNLVQQGADPESVGAGLGAMIVQLNKGESEFKAFVAATKAATEQQRKTRTGAQFFANPALMGADLGGLTSGSNLNIGALADAALRDRSPGRGVDINQLGESLVNSLVKDGATEQEVSAAIKSLVRSINSGATEIEATARATETANKVRSRAVNREIISITGNRNAPGDTTALAQRLLASEGVAPAVQQGIRSGAIFTDADRQRAAQEAFGRTGGSTQEQLGIAGVKAELRRSSAQALIAAEKRYTEELKKGATQQQARTAALKEGTLVDRQAARQRRSNLLRQVSNRAGTAGLVSGIALSGLIVQSGGDPVTQGIGGGIGGAVSGGITGGVVGGVPGAVVGTGIGAIVGFTQAFKDAEKQLSRTRLSESVNDVAKSLGKLNDGLIEADEFQEIFSTLSDRTKRDAQLSSPSSPTQLINPLFRPEFRRQTGASSTSEFLSSAESLKDIPEDFRQVFEDAARTQRDIASDGAELTSRILQQRLERGITGREAFRGIGQDEAFQLLGRADREASELAVLKESEEERIAIFIAAGKRIFQEYQSQQSVINDTSARLRELTSNIDLFALRLDSLSRAAQLAATNGNLARSQIESIAGGFSSISQFSLRDISGNLDQVGRPELDQRMRLISGATGGSPELTKAVDDLRFLSTEGVSLLANAAASGDIAGDSAEVLVNRIFNEGGFENLSPIVQTAFEKRINDVFGGKLGTDTSLAEILQQDPKFIEGIIGDLGKSIREATNTLSQTIEKSANEYAQNLNVVTQKQLQLGSLQDSVISRFQDTVNRISELRGNITTGTQARANRNQLVEAATRRGGIGGTTDAKAIGAEISRLGRQTGLLEERRQGAGTPEEIAALNNQIAENNRRNSELRGALDTLAKDVRELSAIEKQLADVQRRRQAGRGLAETLITAQLDPKAFTQLTQGITGIRGIVGGGPLTADTFAAGKDLANQLAGVLPAAQGEAFRKFISERNIQRLAQGNPQLAQQLRDAEGDTEEARLLSQYETASKAQIAAIQVQEKILKQEIGLLINTNDQLLSQQLAELRQIKSLLGGGPANNNQENREREINREIQRNRPQQPMGGQRLFDPELIREAGRGRQRFTGGLINGGFSKSRSDNKTVSVQGGEFVVNRLATRDNKALLEAINAGRNVGFVNGGQVGAGRRNSNGGISMGNPQFMSAMNAFSSSASRLSQSLNNISVISNQLNRVAEQLRNIAIPERIQIESAPMQVNVIINGAEMFAEMKPEIQNIVQDKIKRALSDAINPVTGETHPRFN